MRPIKWFYDFLFGTIPEAIWKPTKPQDWRCIQCHKLIEIDHDANRPRIYEDHFAVCTKECNHRYLIDEAYDSASLRFVVKYCELTWANGHCTWKMHDSCVVVSEEEGHAWAKKNYPFAHYDAMVGGG